MIVVVTGGRTFDNYDVLRAELDRIHHRTAIGEIRHGAAPGADALASHWAYERKVNVRAFGAQWGDSGPSAGPARNRTMLEAEPLPHLVVAFPTANSRGTWSCVRLAKERAIPVIVVE